MVINNIISASDNDNGSMFAQILATATARAEAIEMKSVEHDTESQRTAATSRNGRTRNESSDWSTSDYTDTETKSNHGDDTGEIAL